MASETSVDHEVSSADADVEASAGANAWQAGVAGGLVAGAVMGVMLTMQMTPVIENAIPALWGLEGGLAGWVIHMVNSAVFGLIFATAVSLTPLRRYASRLLPGAGLGLAYGVALWVVAAAVVMPVWLQAVGFPGAPSVPNFNPTSLMGHAVFGVVLGGLYAALR